MELEKHIQVLKWSDIRTLNEAGHLYLLVEQLELTQVAQFAIKNDHNTINNYLSNGLIAPPTKEEIRFFNTNENMDFRTIKTEPFLFAQRIK